MKQRIKFFNFSLIGIILLAFFLRFYRLPELMVFGGDVARDYFAARNIFYLGKWPLLGSPSSVPWLHQGAFFTYVLGIILFLGRYNPLAGGYFVALTGVFSVWLVYHFAKQFFSEKVGIWASFFYASSPLIVIFDRYPYHQSLISLFTLFFFLSLFWAMKKNANFFIVSALVLGILLQLELSNLVLLPILFILLLDYCQKIKLKILLLSLGAFIVPWIPKIIYDFKTGFTQTLGLVAWALHKIIPINYLGETSVPGISMMTRLVAIADYLAKIIFWPSSIFSALLFFSALYFLIREFGFSLAKRKNSPQVYLLVMWGVFPFFGFLIQGSPSEAYVPVVFALCAILMGLIFEKISTKYKFLSLIFTIFILFNGYFLVRNDYFVLIGRDTFPTKEKYNLGQSYEIRRQMAEYIVLTTKENDYNLVPLGSYGQFSSAKLDLAYLTWYLGHEPSLAVQEVKYYVFNKEDNLQLNKEKTKRTKEFPYMVIATNKND